MTIADDKDSLPNEKEPQSVNVMVVSGSWTTQPLEGGVRRHVITLVEALKRKHNVSIFVPDWGQKYLIREPVDGVSVFRRRLAVAPTSGHRFTRQFLSWLLNLPGTLLSLRKVVVEQRIDVVFLHQVTAGSQFNLWILHKLGGPPYVVGFHGRETRDFLQSPWLSRFQMTKLIRDAAYGVAVSQDLVDLGKANGWLLKDLAVIPSGADPKKVAAAADAPAGQLNLVEPYFVMLGRLHTVKGQDLAIEAWQSLCREYPHVHLVLIGHVAEQDGYRQLALQTGCGDRIHFLGKQSHDSALAWLKGATGLIQASRSEGGCAPFAILEAALLRIPVLVSGIPALEEIIQHEVTGLVFKTEDPPAIANAVKRLLCEGDLASRIGNGLHQYACAELTSERMAERYAAVFQEAAGK